MENKYNNNPENENFLFGKDKKLPFIVPDGYFDSFVLALLGRIEVMEEIREFSSLSDIDKVNSYIVPGDYFNTSKNQLEVKCELSDFSVLSSIPKRSLPQAGDLSVETILGKTKDDELGSLKTLSSIRRENKFEVSEHYFETSADTIKAAVQASGRSAKVVSIFIRPKMLLAYAAAVAAIVCAVFYFNDPAQQMIQGDCHTLACLEKNEILNDSKTVNSFNEEDLYDMVDADQLEIQLSAGDSIKVSEDKK